MTPFAPGGGARLSPRGRWVAVAILFGFVALSVAYSLVVPAFEAPDELYHYGFARHLAQGNPLPVQSVDAPGPWEQEGSQAPLYYMVAGALTRPIDQSDFEAWAVRNPRANIGNPLYPGNKNYMLYSGATRPMQGANLALHVGRWWSTLLGVGTLLGTLWLALRAFAGRANREALSLGAMALVAAIPQFAFLSGSLTNDALITTVAALTLAWLAVLVARPAAQPIRWLEWALLGALLGLAALSKLQGLGLFVLAALAGLGMAWQRRDWKLPLRALLPVALPAALVAGWWYLRNIRLYGDWSGLNALLTINGRRAGAFELADWWLEFRGLRYSFWGLFGWFNLLLPNWLYILLDVVTVVALVGALLAIAALARRKLDAAEAGARRVLLLALAWALLSFALLVYWTIEATGSQGRLLFPALSALAVLAVLGLDFWLRWAPAAVRNAALVALPSLLVGASLYALLVLLPGAYRPAPAVAAPAAGADEVSIRFDSAGAGGATLELVAVELPVERLNAGAALPLTLYWRADAAPRANLELFVQLLDDAGREIANITTHPGWGRNPTKLWQPGALYADRYALPITGAVDDAAPLRARLYVGLIDPATSGGANLPLPARDAGGQPLTPFAGEVTVLPHTPPTVEELALNAADATFGDVIALRGAEQSAQTLRAGETLTVTLLYEALGTPATDYTAFVHLLNAAGAPVAGYDQPPAPGRFPTAHWRAGDRIVATFPLTLPAQLPPGAYTLWTGLYESANVAALLPVTSARNLPSGDGRVQIGAARAE